MSTCGTVPLQGGPKIGTVFVGYGKIRVTVDTVIPALMLISSQPYRMQCDETNVTYTD